MGSHRPPRRALVAFLLAAGTASLLWTDASADEPLRAASVCEAQELRARAADNPGLAIEIPPEFDKAWPSLEACRSHEAAWDEEAPGPQQPIPFSHKHHAGDFEIDCQYCHSGTDQSRAAGVPSVELCMGCHAQFPAEYDDGFVRFEYRYTPMRELGGDFVHLHVAASGIVHVVLLDVTGHGLAAALTVNRLYGELGGWSELRGGRGSR